MCKISLPLLVLAAIIDTSTSNGILGKKGATEVGNVYGVVAKPVASTLGAVVGGLINGPTGVSEGFKGAGSVARKLEENIKSTGNKGIGEQIGGISGSGVGFATATVYGVLGSLTSGNITEGVESADNGAKTGSDLGDTAGDLIGNIL